MGAVCREPKWKTNLKWLQLWIVALVEQIEGVLAYFTHLKCQKRIGDDVGDLKYVFTKNKTNKFVKMTHLIRFIQLIMQEYNSKCLKMYLITLKVFKICWQMFAPIIKVKGSQIHLALAHWKWHTPRFKNYLKPWLNPFSAGLFLSYIVEPNFPNDFWLALGLHVVGNPRETIFFLVAYVCDLIVPYNPALKTLIFESHFKVWFWGLLSNIEKVVKVLCKFKFHSFIHRLVSGDTVLQCFRPVEPTAGFRRSRNIGWQINARSQHDVYSMLASALPKPD
jgi:hypothetical protein